MTLARVIADSGDGVPAGPGLIRCSITRRVGAREHIAHVPRIRYAHELGEARVQRRDLKMHAPLRQIRRELPERCRHALAKRLGLDPR